MNKKFTCKFCNSIRKNDNSLRNHERLCKENPNRQEHPKGMLGKKGWSKGLTKDTDIRLEIAGIKCSKTTKGRKGKLHTLETKNKLSKIRINALVNNAFYSKRYSYKGITLDSSYELKVALELDKHNIKWIRPKSLKWKDGEQIRRYLPDFYLPDYNIYLDPKNDYLIKKDKNKITKVMEYNDVIVIVLNKKELTWNKIKKRL